MQVRKDNEFEFVLGNRQLFSVLAIIVLLLGVFFAMGFFAGRSVGQASAKAEEGQRHPADNTPIVLESPARPETPPEAAAPQPTAAPATAPPQGSAPAGAAAPPQAERPNPIPERDSDRVGEPAPGLYLQVAATTLNEARAMAALLRKSDLSTALAPSSKPE